MLTQDIAKHGSREYKFNIMSILKDRLKLTDTSQVMFLRKKCAYQHFAFHNVRDQCVAVLGTTALIFGKNG